MSITTRLGMTKPGYSDSLDVAVLDTNFDSIDSAITGLSITNTFTSAATLNGAAMATNANVVPVHAGAAPTTAGAVEYDSTQKVLVWGNGSSTYRPSAILFFNETKSPAAQKFTISSIPAGFRNIRIVVYGQVTNAVVNQPVAIRFNTDTSAIYDYNYTQNNNTTVTGNVVAASTQSLVGYLPGTSVARASMTGVVSILIPAYAGTTFEKSFSYQSSMVDSTAANCYEISGGGAWRSTAAIATVEIIATGSSTFTAGSTCQAYLEA